MALLGADLTAKVLDVHATERDYHWGLTRSCLGPCFTEHNPIVRPLVPHPAAFYASQTAEALFFAWLGHRMRYSHTWVRHVWWLPQTLSFANNLEGYAYGKTHAVY